MENSKLVKELERLISRISRQERLGKGKVTPASVSALSKLLDSYNVLIGGGSKPASLGGYEIAQGLNKKGKK